MPLLFEDDLSTQKQAYDHTAVINSVRQEVDKWRALKNPADWRVTPETARLLQHWRHHPFSSIRPFFCQVEAAETIIWLTEVAPQVGKIGQTFLDHLGNANNDANPELMRLALKLATGAGKTTVMAMIIAWADRQRGAPTRQQEVHARFFAGRSWLDHRHRLRVLQPNDQDSYYASRELVPSDMLDDLNRQDRHHQLPRVQTPRTHRVVEVAAVCCSKAGGDELNTLADWRVRCLEARHA